ncbi:integrase arm-type DNA-binding domain-containing protein [Rhizobium mongolense]|uniref:integrase arm-type DNA-binding domain-containing protein n=1 Tax=Rhizobium mongolense TaxID=57676 RepID=UPI0035563725
MAKKDASPINSSTSAEITLSLIKRIEPGEKEFFVSDTALTGFAIRVRPTGAMTYLVIYRFGSGREAPVRRYTIGSTKKVTPDEARRVAKAVVAEVVQGKDPAMEKSADRASPTFDTLKDEYLLTVDAKQKSSTYKLYAHWLDIASEALGRKKAKDVSQGEIERLHVSLKDKPITANRVLSTISSMFTWAMGTKAIPKMENPASGIKKYPEDSRERYLTSAELARLTARGCCSAA